MEKIEIKTCKTFLQESKDKFEGFLTGVRKNKIKMLSPKVQGEVMASAGVIAFINECIKRLEELEKWFIYLFF